MTQSPKESFSVAESVRYNPDVLDVEGIKNPSAAIRSIGTSRRVFLLNHSLNPDEIKGLSYRIKALSSNDGINSIVLANPLEDHEYDGNMSENRSCLPSFMEEGGLRESLLEPNNTFGHRKYVGLLEEQAELGVPYVSSGYDARAVYERGMHKDPAELERNVMNPMMELTHAMRGDFDTTDRQSESRVPVISVPNGLVTDGGYALLSGSYALATHNTSYRILNPLRGLTLDPVGLSYHLPRVGYTFAQESVATHSWGVALLLALAGAEASPADLVSTGLATHYIASPSKLNLLERSLMDLNSFAGQSLKKNPKKYYGHEHEAGPDVNDQYRNVAVGNLIQSLSEYDAAGADEYGCYLKSELDEEGLYLRERDPSLKLEEDRVQMYGELVSPLVNWSATFESVWEEETLEGIMERLHEVAATKDEFVGKKGYEEDVAVAEQAGYFVKCMEARSPLALAVTYALLCVGSDEEETLRSCMEREKRAQMKLMIKESGDFVKWAESGMGVGLVSMPGKASLVREKEGVFDGWRHKSLRDIEMDEIKEILGD